MSPRPDDCIPLDKCVQRGVYHVRARNFTVAVFDGETGFTGPRYKFSDTPFAASEIHYDACKHHGTCSPLELIEMLPEGLSEKSPYVDADTKPLLTYLCAISKRLREKT